jgi:hypothetical protein
MENQNEWTLFPELSYEGKKEAQTLMSKFEKSLQESAVKIMEQISDEFYVNVLNEIESDHWGNFRQKIVDGICDYKSNSKDLPYDFKKIRDAIFKENRQEIINDLNQDMLKEIERLRAYIEKF